MMKGNSNTAADEPVGIVISRGASEDHPPTFFAYVWGPAPELPDEALEVQAA